jgi:hypothetical protein
MVSLMWPQAFLFNWLSPFAGLAPETLAQTINPDWTISPSLITVNEQNSSSPHTERAIVAAESYGRQIGILIEAVMELVPEEKRGSPALQRLAKLDRKIEAIKADRRAERLSEVNTFLLETKRHRREEFDRLINALTTEDDQSASVPAPATDGARYEQPRLTGMSSA